MSEQRKAVIKNADMDEKMQQDAVDIASKALSEYNIEKVREGTNNEISGENVNHLFSPSILWLPAEL
jgi:imidazoleglycerol phosphate dehydratase HisB